MAVYNHDMFASFASKVLEQGIQHKWSTLSTIFEKLLQYGEYNDEKKREYLSLLKNTIIPEFGESPFPKDDQCVSLNRHLRCETECLRPLSDQRGRIFGDLSSIIHDRHPARILLEIYRLRSCPGTVLDGSSSSSSFT